MAGKSLHERHCPFDFGRIAGGYDKWYRTREGRKHDDTQKRDVLRFLPQPHLGDRLLEVGGGTGHWSSFFAACGYAVVSVDISEEMARVAKNQASPPCWFAVADACLLPFRDRSFEVVAAMATLEFVSDVCRALNEMFRCARTGSSVLIGTLNRLAPTNQRRLADGKQPYASGRLFAPGELYELLAPFGRVRMIASPVSSGAVGSRLPAPAEEPRSGTQGALAGAFIVAEVRT